MAKIDMDLDAWMDEKLRIYSSVWIGDNAYDIDAPIPLKDALESVLEGHRVGLTGEFSDIGKKDLRKMVKRLNATAKWFEKKVGDEC